MKRSRTDLKSRAKAIGQARRNLLRTGTASARQAALAASRNRGVVYHRYAERPPTHGEVKCVDQVMGDYQDITSWSQFCYASPILQALNGTKVGSGFFNRIGRKIHMKSVEIRLNIRPSATAATQPTLAGQRFPQFRLMIIYDRQPNGAKPTVSDILQCVDFNGAASATPDLLDQINMVNRERFTLLRDKQMTCAPIGSDWHPIYGLWPAYPAENFVIADEGLAAHNQHLYIPLMDLVTEYKDSTGSYTDITTGTLWMLLWNNDINLITEGSNALWCASWTSRLRFRD